MAPAPSFLSLPGEIRNVIYEDYIDNCEAVELIGNRVRPPPLAQVSRQVRKEFFSLWSDQSTTLPKVFVVKAVVFDLNFQWLRNFLEASSTPNITRIQERLAFTRAAAFVSLNAAESMLISISDSFKSPSAQPSSSASLEHGRYKGKSIKFTADVGPNTLPFSKTKFAKALQMTVYEHHARRVAPLRAALEEALRERDASESSASAQTASEAEET